MENKHFKPTESELEILRHLWAHGPSTVRDVNDALSAEKEVGYTTTLKLMQIMAEKGLVTRVKDGRTHIYQAVITQENTQMVLLDRILETAFGGSAARLVMHALGNKNTNAEEIQQIRNLLDQLEGGTK